MAELMHQNNGKQRQIFKDIPGYRRIPSGAALNLVHGYKEPPPVQKNVHSEELEQVD
jgi:hypothetical protein